MRNLNLIQKIAVKECMNILATHISTLDNITDISLYTVFQTIINEEFNVSINNLSKFFKEEIPKHIFDLQELNKKSI